MRKILAAAGTCLLAVCANGLAQATAAIAALPQPAVAAAIVAPCPTPQKNWPPAFTLRMLEENLTGSVLLGAGTDACGRVTSVVVQTSSGHRMLDEAAIKAVREWTLSPAQRAQAVAGVVPIPVDFRMVTVDSSQTHPPAPTAPDWPPTHRHPRYVLMDGTGDYANAADAEVAIDAMHPSLRTSPYPIASSNFEQLDTPTGREFWYFIHDGSKPVVAVRYQPVFDHGEPIVRLTVICDKLPQQCDAIRALIRKGLEYARARR